MSATAINPTGPDKSDRLSDRMELLRMVMNVIGIVMCSSKPTMLVLNVDKCLYFSWQEEISNNDMWYKARFIMSHLGQRKKNNILPVGQSRLRSNTLSAAKELQRMSGSYVQTLVVHLPSRDVALDAGNVAMVNEACRFAGATARNVMFVDVVDGFQIDADFPVCENLIMQRSVLLQGLDTNIMAGGRVWQGFEQHCHEEREGVIIKNRFPNVQHIFTMATEINLFGRVRNEHDTESLTLLRGCFPGHICGKASHNPVYLLPGCRIVQSPINKYSDGVQLPRVYNVLRRALLRKSQKIA